MGCDIHLCVEYRRATPRDDSWWSWGGVFLLPRHYELFGRLAGVRGPGPAVADPRGIPSDASWEVRDGLGTDRDFHSHSWLTADEFLTAAAPLFSGQPVPESGRPDWPLVMLAVYALREWGYQARVVFAFDS